mgnify:CR=1 FL=1
MATRTNTKILKPLVIFKRNGKPYSNYKSWLAERERIKKQVLELRKSSIKPEHVSKDTRPKGNRIELKLDDVSLLHIEILRELGIKKTWSDNDFILDNKR